MKINIGSVINYDGASLEISGEYKVDPFEFFGSEYAFEKPLSVTGLIKNIGGALKINLNITGEYRTLCDRCACEITNTVQNSTEENVTENADDFDSEMFSLSGFVLDISGALDTLLITALPMTHLCKEDCRGLCPKCGANLNLTECNCDTTRYDPRFAIFRKLSENGEV
ncbi:MAG: DUF177 domain-containing protein [Clostridia bacterium]|nr:DUF177 domain-containing protein [Clostridia bacterium]